MDWSAALTGLSLDNSAQRADPLNNTGKSMTELSVAHLVGGRIKLGEC